MKGFDSCRIALVIQEGDGLSDQWDRGFVEPAVERDGSIPIHLSGNPETEVIV